MLGNLVNNKANTNPEESPPPSLPVLGGDIKVIKESPVYGPKTYPLPPRKTEPDASYGAPWEWFLAGVLVTVLVFGCLGRL